VIIDIGHLIVQRADENLRLWQPHDDNVVIGDGNVLQVQFAQVDPGYYLSVGHKE
jgi:hypothetical protein